MKLRRTTFYLLCMIFVLSFYALNAQTGTIRATVLDAQTKSPLEGAVVRLANTGYGGITEFEGITFINDIKSQKYDLIISYFSYRTDTIKAFNVQSGDTTNIVSELHPDAIQVAEVLIVAEANREAETVLLLDQKNALIAEKTIGAAELSRKGLSDAESAVSTVSGISKQESVKNVFVRGLGDRYNVTLLNGLPIPSEDPEYKNIALSFFESDIIKNIGVEKVFPVHRSSDVGGAIIDINSRQLQNDYSLNFSATTGSNSRVFGTDYRMADGFNYLGFTSKHKENIFSNQLDPRSLALPVNESYRLSGGKKFELLGNQLSFYGVASHSSDYSFTEEKIKNMTTDGTVYQDQTGQKFSGTRSQTLLTNLHYKLNSKHTLSYNFLMLHSTGHYVGEYKGRHAEKYQDGVDETGYMLRQQINDNRLYTNQLISQWILSDRWQLNADLSFSSIAGYEPDRRENNFTRKADGSYGLTGGNRQKRFFSELNADDFSTNIALNYDFTENTDDESALTLGYTNRAFNTAFDAIEYGFTAIPGAFRLDDLVLDELYNEQSYEGKKFKMTQSPPYSYDVKNIKHGLFADATYRFTESFSAQAGVKYDLVDMDVAYDVPGQKGKDGIERGFFLPGINLKYTMNDKHTLRLGMSKTYTLPQAKEISPYQYVNIGFTSEGNAKLKHSDNYNFDLKWDYYFGQAEVLTAALFYKKIFNPIGRVDKGNSAGILSYDNIGEFANVQGIELEFRKDIFRTHNSQNHQESKLSLGINLSGIMTQTKLDLLNTPERYSALEGASPFIMHSDLTYRFSGTRNSLSTSLILNYFSNRIYTIGTVGYNDVVENAVPTLDFVVSSKLGKLINLKLKFANLLDPTFRLTRKSPGSDVPVVLNEYRKGMNLSIGLSVNL